MAFAPGNTASVGHGRPRKGASLRELLRNRPLKDKRELVAKAYEYALAGDARWAEWIAKHSGEGAAAPEEFNGVPEGSILRLREVIVEIPRHGDRNGSTEPLALDAGRADQPDHASGPAIRVAE